MFVKKDKILLFGFGRYGEQIGVKLIDAGYEVYVADASKKHLKQASLVGIKELFVLDMENDEQISDLLLDYGFKKAICAFDEEEENVYMTITLKSLFRHLHITSVCESKDGERKLKLAGADHVLDTMYITSNRLFFLLEKPAVAEALDQILFKDPSILIKQIEVQEKSELDGKYLKDIQEPPGLKIIGLIDKELKEQFIYVTRGINHKIDAGDIFVVIGKKKVIEEFRKRAQG